MRMRRKPVDRCDFCKAGIGDLRAVPVLDDPDERWLSIFHYAHVTGKVYCTLCYMLCVFNHMATVLFQHWEYQEKKKARAKRQGRGEK